MGEGYTLIKKGYALMASSSKESNKATVASSTGKAMSIKDSSKEEKLTALASMSSTAADLRVSGRTIGSMAKAKRNGGMAVAILVSILMASSMARESIGGQMEAGMSVSTSMTRSMAKGSWSSKMEISISESGVMAKSITKDFKLRMVSEKKAAGKMVKESKNPFEELDR